MSSPSRLQQISGPVALAISVLSLIVMASGIAYAKGLAKNSVDTRQLRAGAVTSAKIADGNVRGPDIANGAVGAAAVADGSLTAADLAELTITAAQIANFTIDGTKIAQGSIATSQILNGSVTSDKIAEGAVNALKISPQAVGSTQLANEGIFGEDIAFGAITGNKLAGDTVTGAQIDESSLAGIVKGTGRRSTWMTIAGATDTWSHEPGIRHGVADMVFRCSNSGQTLEVAWRRYAAVGNVFAGRHDIVVTQLSEGVAPVVSDTSIVGSTYDSRIITVGSSANISASHRTTLSVLAGETGAVATIDITAITRFSGQAQCAIWIDAFHSPSS